MCISKRVLMLFPDSNTVYNPPTSSNTKPASSQTETEINEAYLLAPERPIEDIEPLWISEETPAAQLFFACRCLALHSLEKSFDSSSVAGARIVT